MAQLSARQICDADALLIADAGKIPFFPLVVERGEGCRLIDPEGRRYLDFTAGRALANTGYSHARVRRAIVREPGRSAFAGLVSGMHAPAVELAGKQVSLVPGGFEKKAWLGLPGSDADETVGRLLPMATGKRRIVSFIGGCHGTTGTAMGMSAHIAMPPRHRGRERGGDHPAAGGRRGGDRRGRGDPGARPRRRRGRPGRRRGGGAFRGLAGPCVPDGFRRIHMGGRA